ncbi:hypothetical protein PR003_g18809 [Phytophthora rubi]|uniref:Uncharacterized protein n=1 Tax=Phytophthora rubi TaxID=129364 RepID=A0A6A4E4F1_9STRA|nr:hypothetical protein PR002_g19381 [Phytophthora rubi]KAE9001647.1 hypothetical protein PR001_g18467 [Phytophthora rubi]KAE9316099.1 hypothetical protein PR003_g18809 [Phytophthora rubi]
MTGVVSVSRQICDIIEHSVTHLVLRLLLFSPVDVTSKQYISN